MFSRGCTSAEKERWQEAICQIRRARWLPVAWKVKKATIARGPMAKAVTGWFWRKPTQKMVNQLQLNISNSLGEAKCSSVYLRHLLRGHDLHAQFSITSRLVGAVWRQVNKRPQSTPIGWHAKGFTTVFSQLMSQWEWNQSRPGVWRHATLGNISFLHPLQKLDLIQHNLRESFRMWCWSKHHAHSRRDSFSEVRYNSDKCQIARKAADLFSQFQVLSGGTISPACFSRMRQIQIPECSECHDAMTLEHAWTCPKFHAMRTSCLGSTNLPTCPFVRRTGWGDTKVLNFLVQLRKLWLDERWSAS